MGEPIIPIGAIAFGEAQFGEGSGSIFLDDVRCVGFESRLIDCPANPIGIHNCIHGEDAGVQCGLTGKGTACSVAIGHK
jgi:deleted-in-malignant-brain-tumors protein 1